MLARKIISASQPGGPVDFVAGTRATTSSGANRSVPSHQANDMIVLAEYVNGTTPPALRSGFTNITTQQIRFVNNTFSVRFQFQIDVANNISTISGLTGFSFCFVLRGARSAGQSAFVDTNAFGTSIGFAQISGLNTTGRALLIGSSFGLIGSAGAVASSPSGPFSQVSSFVYGIGPENSAASFAAGNYLTSSLSLSLSSFIMEFLP